MTTPQPVLDNEGVLRELAAGETFVTEGGQEIPVEVVVDIPEVVAIEGDDFAVRVEGAEGGSTIVLEPGGTVRVSGFGFEPASQVDVWLFTGSAVTVRSAAPTSASSSASLQRLLRRPTRCAP